MSNTSNIIISWNTVKTETGFKAIVKKLTPRDTPDEKGSYCDTEIVVQPELPTRARAKTYAQKYCRFLKRQIK